MRSLHQRSHLRQVPRRPGQQQHAARGARIGVHARHPPSKEIAPKCLKAFGFEAFGEPRGIEANELGLDATHSAAVQVFENRMEHHASDLGIPKGRRDDEPGDHATIAFDDVVGIGGCHAIASDSFADEPATIDRSLEGGHSGRHIPVETLAPEPRLSIPQATKLVRPNATQIHDLQIRCSALGDQAAHARLDLTFSVPRYELSYLT